MVRLRPAVVAGVLLAASAAQAHLVVDMKVSIRGLAFVAPGQQTFVDVFPDDLANDNAIGVVVTTTLPSNLTFVSVQAPGWKTCSHSKGVVTCSAEELTPGEHPISIRTTAGATGVATVRASVASIGSSDPEEKNDTTTFNYTIYDPARCAATPPQLLSPAANATLDTATVAFSWTASDSGARYALRASTEQTSPVTVTSTTSTSAVAALDRGTTTWWVDATFTDCPPVSSVTRKFTKTRGPVVALADVATGFVKPSGLAFGPNGELYATDEGASVVYQIANGQKTVLAGVAGQAGAVNGQFATFNGPTGIAVTPIDGFVYVTDTRNNDVRILYTGGPFVPAFSLTNGTLKAPGGIAATFRGSLYVADTGSGAVRKLTPVSGTTGVFTVTSIAQLTAPAGVAVDDLGNVYVADDHAVKRLPGTTLAAGFDQPGALAFDAAGNLYVVDRGTKLLSKIAPSGLVTPLAQFADPAGVAVGPDGKVYVADAGARAVVRVDVTLAEPPPPGPRRRAAGR